MNKKHIFTALVLALVLVLAACGNDTTENAWEKIQEEGSFTFAMTGAYPPFNYISENGELIGFDIDIANALAQKMGVEAEPITTEWDGIIGGLNGGRFDLIIGSMAVTEERVKQVSFTDPYYYDGAQFFAQPGSGLGSIEDLEEGTVGVVTGTTFHDLLKDMDNVRDIMQFTSDVDNFMSVAQGRSDGLVTGIHVGLRAPLEYGVEVEPVGEMLYQEEIAIGVRQDEPELLDAVNRALQEIQEDGTYEEISEKWFGVNLLDVQ